MPLSTLRLVCGSMALALAGFLALAHLLPRFGVDLSVAFEMPILRIAWIGLAFANLVTYFVLRHGRANAVAKRIETLEPFEARVDAVREAYSHTTLIGCALAEGTGLFGVVIAALSGQPTDFWFAVPALAALLVIFPTQRRLERYADPLL